jgi:hypothetical protein
MHGKGFSSTTGQTRAKWSSNFVRVDSDFIQFICDVTMFADPPKTSAITEFRWITRPRLVKTLVKRLRGEFAAAEIEGASVNINDVTMEVRMYKFNDDTNWPSPEPLNLIADYRKIVKSLSVFPANDDSTGSS